MGHYHPVLFDLDGTVADTHPGILSAVDALLDGLGLPRVEPAVVRSLTGKGIDALVEGLLRAAGAEPVPGLLARARASYATQYAESCARGARLYPGMRALLDALPPPLALLTNKARPFTERILRELSVEGLFRVVVCGDEPGAQLKPDPWPVREALRRLGGGEAPILIGDTASDLRAAAAAGIPCGLVAWGHQQPGGAEANGLKAQWVARTPAELASLLERRS